MTYNQIAGLAMTTSSWKPVPGKSRKALATQESIIAMALNKKRLQLLPKALQTNIYNTNGPIRLPSDDDVNNDTLQPDNDSIACQSDDRSM